MRVLLILVIMMKAVTSSAVLSTQKLGFVFETLDPFLFCVHHKDAFPGSADGKVPSHLLRGRNIGSDFEVKDGFRMYHGEGGVPGFPSHPHYGFETITIVPHGLCDHHDSLGATARFGHVGSGSGSDTQWVTTGNGMSHSEMFPLLSAEKNPLELFQIWINLPKAKKTVQPYFTMLWSEKNCVLLDNAKASKVTVIADEAKLFCKDKEVESPPPDSWASHKGSNVAIVLIELGSGGEYMIPKLGSHSNRKLFYYSGEGSVNVDGTLLAPLEAAVLDSDRDCKIANPSKGTSSFLLLQGNPIGEKVYQRGPFVASSPEELQATFARYQRTQFGGWPWPETDGTHGNAPRFAKHANGKEEYPEGKE